MKPKKHTCGVPPEKCGGSKLQSHARWNGSTKAHDSAESAFKCHVRHLLNTGWTQVSSREFKQGDGPILVLTKPSRFGSAFYYTKEKTRYYPKTRPFSIASY